MSCRSPPSTWRRPWKRRSPPVTFPRAPADCGQAPRFRKSTAMLPRLDPDPPISNTLCFFQGVDPMTLGTILLIVLVLLLIGAIPRWSHSSNWGYFPSGGLGIVLIIVLVLVLTGRI